ncbi:sulfite exporter TauE/SafE family protein [Amphibacillus sediminis]|uniref:sulfite exporter TauE/SafE family protein n=1 Tax=Amphibacillus sediminis TaxID=360185 RepID=UPI000836232B|nr:sulfite exporter TauE/SafE family protein [Amphibacillus sediminis]
MILIYFLISFLATVLGSIAGLGGGVVIKPLLDLLNHYDVATIGVLSAATVFSMSIISLIKAKTLKIKLDIEVSFLIAIGSILGGLLGKGVFNYLINVLQIEEQVAIFQSAFLAFLMLVILLLTIYSDKFRPLLIRNKLVIIAVGLTLGILSAFLGIGGGPLNVVVLGLLFSMKPKEAAFNSIFIIFFSQLSSLILTWFDTGFGSFNLSMLFYMIIGGIIGGWTGSSLTNRISDKQVRAIFTISVFVILLINIYNAVAS